MKKVFRKFFILLAVFLAGLLGTALLLNSETTDDRTDMNDPYLPEVMVQFDDVLVNRMYGYRQKMQVDFTRDSLTPLDTTKELTFVINPYDTKVTSLAYEIRTSDGSRVIENRKIKSLGAQGSYLTARIEIESDLRVSQEYSMQLTLETEVGLVYYYTRVVSRSGLHASAYAAFVQSFCERSLDKSAAEDLASYMESTTESTTRNFSNITITSKLSDVSWGNLSPSLEKRGVPIIKDINETTASITLDYQISARDDEGITDQYDVSEFYRMRYTEERILLLDFNRSTQQVYQPRSSMITDDGLLLGIRGRDVTYLYNEEAETLAFVQTGDLFTYSPDDGKFVRIFSFRRDENSDFRDTRTEHGIKLIRVSDNGDVDFIVYGYMNRGNHEGMSRLSVCHYSSDQNAVEEKVFIPSTKSYEFLEMDLGILSYVNEDNQLFLVLGSDLCMVNIETGNYEVLEENVDEDSFVVSQSNAHAAWQLTGEKDGQIRELDFDTLEPRDLMPEEGYFLRTVGFMNEDLIYGVTNAAAVLADSNGRVQEGLLTLRIEAFDGTLKKDYSQENLYILDPEINGTMMEFELARMTSQGYAVVKKDNIMNNQASSANQISIELTSTSRTGVIVRLAMSDVPDADQALVLYAKQKNRDVQEIAIDTEEEAADSFYVYAKGGLNSILSDPAEAVQLADELAGVVLNRSQQYIWERGNTKEQNQINLSDIPDAFLSGNWDMNSLQEGLAEDGEVLDLSGCTLTEILYEISVGRPVIAKTSAQDSVVIIGFDAYNTWLYDPMTQESYPYGLNDSTELFESAGNIFITYVENI